MIKQKRRPKPRVVPCIVGAMMVLGLTTPGAEAASIGSGSIINVWNGAASGDGSYLNATNIAQLLVFTTAEITAGDEIRYLETVNLATSPAGAAVFSITHTAPITSIGGDVTMGTGNFIVNSQQIDLSGSIYKTDSSLLGGASLPGTATTVNVLSNASSLQQSLYLTQNSPGLSTVTATFGSATSLSFDYDTHMFLSGGLLSGAVSMNHLDSYLELHGYGFELDTGSGFTGIGSGLIGATSGQLKGYLDSGDPFLVSFTQGMSGQISVVSAVPIPAAAWLFGSGLLGLLGIARRRNTRM